MEYQSRYAMHGMRSTCLRQPLLGQNTRLHQRKTFLQPFTNLKQLKRSNKPCVEDFQSFERRATSTPIPLQQWSHKRWTQQQYAGMWKAAVEDEYEITDIDGTIPPELEGTWFRNGPGMFEIDGHPMHVFDGHGLVGRVAFRGGRAHFVSRFVRTPVFEEEMRCNEVLYRGFGTQKPGGMLANMFDIRDKPVANTSLVEWSGKLWALWEAHRPFVLDPVTLNTLGEETLRGFLKDSQAFCAHPRFDPESGRLCAFSLGLRHAEGNLHILEINPDCSVHQSVTLPGILNPVTYLHDFVITRSWYVFYRPPLKVQLGKLGGYLLGTEDQTKMVDFDDSKPGQWLLISRNPDGPRIEIDTPPQFIWHYASVEEDDETGALVVDACIFDRFSPGSFDLKDPASLSKSTLCRCVVDPKCRTATRTQLADCAGDFPTVNPVFIGRADYKYVYMAACTERDSAFPFQSVVKVNVQSREVDEWKAPDGCFVGEAVFVPRSGPSTLEALHDSSHSCGGDVKSSRGSISSSNIDMSGSSDGANHGSASVGSSYSKGSLISSFNGIGSADGHSYGSVNRSSGNTSGSHARSQAAEEQRQHEDDGFLITPMYDGNQDRSSIAILDARDLSSGPLAMLHLKGVMPFAFHCLWSDTFQGPKDWTF